MDSSLEEMEDSSNELDIAKDINGCIQSLDDDIGPNYNAVSINDGTTKSTNSSRSSSTSSTSSSSSGSSSSSSSSTSSALKKSPVTVATVTKVQVVDQKQKSELYTKKQPTQPVPFKSLELSQFVPERVLYPAKLARKPLELSTADPHWMRNDIHQKFSRPKISSTGNTPAAHRKSRSRSKVRGKCESGYKTDNSVTSNKSGYRSDHSMAAHQRRRRKSRAPSRDPSTSRNYPQAAPGDIDDLAKLMGLHLDTNESTSSTKNNKVLKKNDTNNNQNRQRKPLATSYLGCSGTENLNRQLLDRKIALTSKSAFHNAIKSGASFVELARQSKTMQEWSLDDSAVLPVKAPKSLGRGISIKSRRMSTQSRTGSVRSASSNISRLRRGTLNPQNSAWIEAEIGTLNGSFMKMTIAPARSHHQDLKSKRQNKKKKMTEAHSALSTPTTKRRTKKLEPEDHKLPLKKRTYLLADGASAIDVKSKKSIDKRRRVETTTTTVKVLTKNINNKQSRPPKSKNVPTAGIFEPSSSLMDSQLQLNDNVDLLISAPIAKGGVVDNLLNKTGAGDVNEVQRRKRRRVNRTGFPNKKRPKKKVVVAVEQQQKVPTNKITKFLEQEMKLTPRQLTLKQIKEQKEEEVQPLVIEKKRRKTITTAEVVPLRPRRNTMYQEPLPIVPEPDVQPPPQKKLKTANRRLTVFQEQMPVIEEHPVPEKRQRARRKTLCDEQKHKMPKIESTASKVEVDQHPVTIIAKNKYQIGVEKKAYQDSLIAGKCDCKKLKNECDEQCHNRSMCIECDVKICGKDCTNTAITTNRLVKGVEKYLTSQKGWGIRTTENINKKQLILEYTGEVMFKENFKERMQTIYKDDRHHYCLEIGNNIVIDGHRMGSLCRFVNHSCKPNCKMAKVQVDGLPRMVLQADMDIPAGTELTYDYKFLDFESSEPQTCYCGEDICRGTLSAPQRRGSFTVKDGEPSGRKGGGRKAKGRILKQCPLKVSCFLNRNLRKIERINPELLAMYKNMLENLDDDPKAGFVFFAKQRDVQSVIGSPLQIPDVTELITEPLVILEELPEVEIPEAELSSTEQTQFLLSICTQLLETKDDDGKHCYKLIAIPQKSSSSPLDEGSNHDRISNPMCFDAIIKAVKTGVYDDRPHVFNYNIKILLDNCVKFYGVKCPQFRAMKLLKDKFTNIKKDIKVELKRLWIDDFMTDDFLEIKRPTKSKRKIPKADQEDVIQCICGMFLEEGVMVQCSTCKCWQHVDCVHADTNLADYYCEACEPRTVDYEIIKTGELLNGNQCYLTLMRGDTLQVRVGDAIYVLLDIKIKDEAGNEDQSHTYKTIGNVSYDRCDIVRVDSLFKDVDGKSFVVGHHYIRPHEVFHEPTRKFYNNELMRGTAFETIPIEMVIDTCWVLDTSTYFKGRPLNSDEKHVYVAEFKVDKGCKQFTTIKSKSRQPVCTKNYAFYKFEEQLKQKRTAMPHKIEDIPKKPKKELVKKAGTGKPHKGAIRFQKSDSRRNAIKQKVLRLESSVYRLKQNIPSTSTAESSGVAGRFDITQFRESYLDWLPEPMMRVARDVRSQTPGKRSFRRSQTPMKPVELVEEKLLKVVKDKTRTLACPPDVLKKSRSRTPVKVVKKQPAPDKILEVLKPTVCVVPGKVQKPIVKDLIEVDPPKPAKKDKKSKVICEKLTVTEDFTLNNNIDLETMITPSRIEKVDKKHKTTDKNPPEVALKKKKQNESHVKISEVTEKLKISVKIDKVSREVSKSRSKERTRLQPLRTTSKSPSAANEKKELPSSSKTDESIKKDLTKTVKKDHKEVSKSHSSNEKSLKDPKSSSSRKSSDRRESPSGDRKSRSRKQKSHDKERSREAVKKSSSKGSSRDPKKSSLHHSKDAKEVKGDSKDTKVSKDVSKSSKESSSKKSSKDMSKDFKSKNFRDNKDSKDSNAKLSKDVKSSKDSKSQSKDSKSKNVKDSKSNKESSKSSKDNNLKIVKDVKESKDNKEPKEVKEPKEKQEIKETQETQELKEIKDFHGVEAQDFKIDDVVATLINLVEEPNVKDPAPVVTSEKMEKHSEKPSSSSPAQQATTSVAVDKCDKTEKSQRATRSRTPGRTKDTATTSTNVTTLM